MTSIGEYIKVVEACDKAIGPAKAGDFAVAKTAADEADLSVSRANAYKIEPEPETCDFELENCF